MSEKRKIKEFHVNAPGIGEDTAKFGIRASDAYGRSTRPFIQVVVRLTPDGRFTADMVMPMMDEATRVRSERLLRHLLDVKIDLDADAYTEATP